MGPLGTGISSHRHPTLPMGITRRKFSNPFGQPGNEIQMNTSVRIFRHHRLWLGFALGLFVLFGLAFAVFVLPELIRQHSVASDDGPATVEGWSLYRPMADQPQPVDQQTSLAFLQRAASDVTRFDTLFSYFFHGFVVNATSDFALIHYPGLPSWSGYSVSGLEGFARTAPLFAAWLYSGRPREITDPQTGKTYDLVAVLQKGLLAGTDRSSPNYWGDIHDDDQRKIEAADIARVLWLTRDKIWFKLDESSKAQLAIWLLQTKVGRPLGEGNVALFPVVVEAFLKNVGYVTDFDRRNFDKFKTNYLQNGWFRDGPNGNVDYYNAWGIPYDIYWLHLFDPSFDHEFIQETLTDSGAFTAHLISLRGIPIMGRSICYRTGIPSAVIMGSKVGPAVVSPGLARRALDATWDYFVDRGVLREGTLTMGYFNSDPRIVDRYSGAGSCHWGLRSLTLAFMASPSDAFWTSAGQPLPVETSDYRLELPKLDWTVQGYQATQDIEITIGANANDVVAVSAYSIYRQVMEAMVHRPLRPKNFELKYKLRKYSAIHPFHDLLKEQ